MLSFVKKEFFKVINNIVVIPPSNKRAIKDNLGTFQATKK